MFDTLSTLPVILLIASLFVLVALWAQIRRDLKTSYFRGFAASLAGAIRHGAESTAVQRIMRQHAVQLTDLDRRGVAKQDLAMIRQCVEGRANSSIRDR